MNQQNESRQAPDTGSVAPSPTGTGNAQPGVPNSAPGAAASPSGTGNPATSTPGATGTTGTGTTGTGTTTP